MIAPPTTQPADLHPLVPVVQDLGRVRTELLETLDALRRWDEGRVADRTRHTHRMLERGMETGSQSLRTVGLLGLIADCQNLRQEADATVYDRLVPYTQALDRLIAGVSERLQLPPPPAAAAAARKRRRREQVEAAAAVEQRVLRSVAEHPRMQDGVVAALRDPERAPPDLSAAEHRLLSTVVTESALLPEVSALYDVYHPNVCLYDTADDRRWVETPATAGVYTGFYASTMLSEFVVHRGHIRRFTLVHLMYCLGFGAADINHHLIQLDDTLYRRVCSDTRIGFLAECFSPRLRLFRGAAWAELWDMFMRQRGAGGTNAPPWHQLTRATVLADDLQRELAVAAADPERLVPSTVLGALHRCYGADVRPYDGWVAMDRLPELEAEFLDGAQRIGGGCLAEAIDALRGRARAWPVCLRAVAVAHVRHLFRTLVLLPRSPQVAMGGGGDGDSPVAVAAWLWRLRDRRTREEAEDRPGAAPTPTWTASRNQLVRALEQTMVAAATPETVLAGVARELDEAQLRECAVARYGEVTEEHRTRTERHLVALDTLVQAAAAHGPDRWTEQQRDRLGYRPSDLLAAVEADAVAACQTPEEYEALVARRLQRAWPGTADPCGDSQLRPATLYPSDP